MMARRRPLLHRIIGRLPAASLPYRVLARLERMQLRRSLPDVGFAASGAVMLRRGGRLVFSRPAEAPSATDVQRANLEAVTQACEAVGAEYFVVRGVWGGLTVVGALTSERERILSTLCEHGRVTPLYVKPGSGGLRLAALSGPADLGSVSAIEVFEFFHDPVTGRGLGSSQACRLEFWHEFPDGGLQAPSPNLRAAEVTSAERRTSTTVEVAGRPYPSIPPFDRRSPFDVTFPVDVVYLWVDGEDPAWQERRRARQEAVGRALPPLATVPSRFREQDELRYSLRSIEQFAPWVRHIYLVTDQQRPTWLVDEHPWLSVVDHREIFPQEALPTFNSHAISARVHHIPELSEHFLLMNDDVFLGQPVAPEAFFHANGVSQFFLSRSPIPSGPVTTEDKPHMAARKRVRDLIESAYGFTPFQTFKHTPVTMRRSWLAHLEDRFSDHYERTVHAPFRTGADIVPSWLHHYAGFAERVALPSSIQYEYFNLAYRRTFRRMVSFLERRSVDCLCLNDEEEVDVAPECREQMLEAFMQIMLPRPSSFEVDVGDRRERSELFQTLRLAAQSG
jgi:hypothetical protein